MLIFLHKSLKFCSFILVILAFDFTKSEHISPHKRSPSCEIFCAKIQCETVKECEGGIIQKNASFCSCCEACVKYLDINESCFEMFKGSLAIVAQSKCKPGTQCQNGKCVFDAETTFECPRYKNIRESRKGIDMYKENIWIPQCELDGTYAAKQKKMRKSICVDESGKKIFGNIDDVLENACVCSRYILRKEINDVFRTKPQEHCTPSGGFAALQCIDNLCYCSDKKTGEVNSHLVTMDFREKLPCYDESIHSKNYLTNCETELQRYRKLIYDFKLKGMKVIGVDRIKCDPDGTFSPTQCTSTNCVCVDKEGEGIKSYHPDSKEVKGIIMTCDCAREEKYQHNSMFRCTKYGNYEMLSCVGDHCVCVDNDGDIISEQSIEDISNEACEELREKLITDNNEILTTDDFKDVTTDDNENLTTDDDDYEYI